MNHPQNTEKNGTTLSSRTRVVNGPLFLRCWQLWWQICQSNYRTPFHRRVCHRWMASKYPCKPAWKPRTAKEIAKLCFAHWTKRQHLWPVFSLLIECLATKPRYATERPNEPTHKFSDLNSFNWKNARENFIGESGLVFKYVFVPFCTCYKD